MTKFDNDNDNNADNNNDNDDNNNDNDTDIVDDAANTLSTVAEDSTAIATTDDVAIVDDAANDDATVDSVAAIDLGPVSRANINNLLF